MLKNKLKEARQHILKLLDDKKTEKISEYELSQDSGRLSDVCIVASGKSARQVEAVAQLIYRHLKSEKLNPVIEGTSKSGWIMIESAGLEIHLFKPELREYYDLESLLA